MQSERAYGVEGGDRSAIRTGLREQYREMLKAVRGSFSTSTYLSVNGIKHALLTLGLQPLSCLDVYSESNLGRSPRPGDINFVGFLKDSMEDLMKSKDQMLGTRQEMYSAESAPESSEYPLTADMEKQPPDWVETSNGSTEKNRDLRPIYILLCIQSSLWFIAHEISSPVTHADELQTILESAQDSSLRSHIPRLTQVAVEQLPGCSHLS